MVSVVSNSSRLKAVCNRLVLPATLLLIFLLPLPLGSNRIWAWALEAMLTASLLLVYVLTCDSACWQRLHGQLKRIKPVLWLMLAWLLWNALFVLPLPSEWVSFLAPAVAQKAASSGVQATGLSLDRYASWVYGLQSLFYVLFFGLVFAQASSARRIWAIWWAVFLAAVLQSLYGLWLVNTGSRGLIYGFYDVSADSLAGSFVNRNHAVAFLSLGLLAGLALRFSRQENSALRAASGQSLGAQDSRAVRFVRFLSSPRRVLDVLLLIVMTGLASTHSRAGVFSGLVAVVVFILLVRNRSVKKTVTGFCRKKTVMALAVLALVAVFAGGELVKTAKRWENTAAAGVSGLGGERWLALEQGWRHGRDYWPWGTGGGSYQNFFVLHRSAQQTHYFDHAHNDYLEFLVESGAGVIFLVWLIGWVAANAWRAQSRFFSPTLRVSAALVLATLAYFLMHGLVDFNARIPANVLVALALTASFLGLLSASDGVEQRLKRGVL